MFCNPVNDAKKEIAALLYSAFEKCGLAPPAAGIEVTPAKDPAHGDFASNCALQAAGQLRQNPRELAKMLAERLDTGGTLIERAQVAGPGFINFYVSDKYYASVVRAAALQGRDYGKSDTGSGKKIMVEFVSANPTGPMHMGNARGGVVGDTLATLLELCGYDVTREFYVNDTGNQVDLLSKSLYARYVQHLSGEEAAVFPEDGYHGEDVRALASEFAEKHGNLLSAKTEGELEKELVEFALSKNISKIKTDLLKYKIDYDVWFYESSLHKSGFVADTIELLKSAGATYESDGALWFTASKYGADKDEVLVKANGFYTYYAVDIAYHRNKFVTRGFDGVIDVLGADHHGHTLRFGAALRAIGVPPEKLRFVLIQLVRLFKNGEVFRMSKRTGKAVSLSDLLDEIPVDAARFFFNYKMSDSSMDFDLDLAVQQNSENPVYYVQYAHARICSIIKNIEAEGIIPVPADKAELSLLSASEERELIRLIAAFPDEVALAAAMLEPTRISRYCVQVAGAFHRFYNACYVRCENHALMQARLSLCTAARTVIKNSLDIIKIEAPEKM